MTESKEDLSVRIARAGQLAALLEVSGYPKPGNVHRTRDFPDLRYEHFLAGSVAMGEPLRITAEEGIGVGKGNLKRADIGLGGRIREGIEAIESSHLGGNTHLGTVLLFVPLSAVGGKVLSGGEDWNVDSLREEFRLTMKATSSEDSLEVYDGIRIALGIEGEQMEADSTSWLGGADRTDMSVTDPATREKLSEGDVSLYEWMDLSSNWDGIARELTTGMEASFEVGFPTLRKSFEDYGDINLAVVHTFLKILSEYPDTFIARKVGLEKCKNVAEAVEIGWETAEEVSELARSILNSGGLRTEEGQRRILKLDERLQSSEGKLNPGTTADLTAASINIALLDGLKY